MYMHVYIHMLWVLFEHFQHMPSFKTHWKRMIKEEKARANDSAPSPGHLIYLNTLKGCDVNFINVFAT